MSNIEKSLFQEKWWMDIVAGENWQELSYPTKYGDIKLVYAFRKRYRFLDEIYSPALTPYTGVYFDFNQEITEAEKYKLLNDAIPALIGQLPNYFRLKVNFLPSFDWWSPLYWLGFSQHTRYTSLLENISDHDAVWKGFNNNIRRNIKKAQKNITVKPSLDAELLYTLFEKTMMNQGRKPGYAKRVLVELCREVTARNAGVILVGEDQEGVAHCGLLLVWDAHTAYYLVGGTDPSLRDSGAMALTMWEAIKEASKHVNIYDFEGSMQKGIDRFVRSFGALPRAYSSVSDGFMANTIVRQKNR